MHLLLNLFAQYGYAIVFVSIFLATMPVCRSRASCFS